MENIKVKMMLALNSERILINKGRHPQLHVGRILSTRAIRASRVIPTRT